MVSRPRVSIARVLAGALIVAGFLGVGTAAVRAVALPSTNVSLASTLVRTWTNGMVHMEILSRPPYPSSRIARMRLVGDVKAANQSAFGTAFMALAQLGGNESDSAVRLSAACESINGALDQMLTSIETGYTGRLQSQLNQKDIQFIHRLIVKRVLAKLPHQVRSMDDVTRVSSDLSSMASSFVSLASSRFSKHHPLPTSGPGIFAP